MENDYIVTTPSAHDAHGLDTLGWAELHAATFAFNMPFCLRLSDNQVILCERVARMLPKKRIVVFGTWHGKQIVAKLFFDINNAKKHMEKDIAGIKSLQNNKIPTPALLYEGKSVDKRIYVLIFERILDARSMDELWQNRKNVDDILFLLKSVVIEIATQHVLGLLQHDLHLKNFLLNERTVYTLDGAQIEIFPNLLSRSISINNLALFLSQLGIDSELYQEKLFKHYSEARGWTLKKEDYTEFFALIKKWNIFRWKKFSKKIYRNSSDFSTIHTWQTFGMYDRRYESPELLQFLANPDSVFGSLHTKMLKAGNSSTVVKVRLDNRDYVVKRYNMKSFWHWLRRCLRQTRASSSWKFAQKLNLFDISTAAPVAFIENRICGLRGKSYYVTEYVRGEHVGDFLSHQVTKHARITEVIKRIGILLKDVAKVDMTHGDLKTTNILIDENNQPVLIDLDGAAEHASLSRLRNAWQDELTRFLENFNSNPVVRKQFEAELEKW